MLWPLLQWCLFCFPQPFSGAALSTSATAPAVKWITEQEHDFGDMRQGRPQVFVFQFQNISPDTMLLQTVRTSCGCTAANWTESPLAPGDNGEVRIEYDAYQGGDFDKKIRVFFDVQRKPEILRIKGTVK